MQIKFGGVVDFDASIEKARAFLRDTEKVASCIPDSRGFARKDDTHFTVNVEMGIGAVKGILAMDCRLEELDDNKYAYTIEGSGAGSNIKVVLVLELSSKGASLAQLQWSSTSDIRGIMTGIGEPIIRRVSSEYIETIIANARQRLSETPVK